MNLVIENLGFEREQNELFEKINFTLTAGMLLQVIGANGSGKTTLLRMIAGFIDPTAGFIRWEKASSVLQRSVFQENLTYLGHQNGLKSLLTVSENIKLMCALQGLKINANSIGILLKQVGLQSFAASLVKTLSAGQQRRLSYVRLPLFSKSLWILDEPTTAVDDDGQIILSQMLDTHLLQGGIAIVATHQPLRLAQTIQTLNLSASKQVEHAVC